MRSHSLQPSYKYHYSGNQIDTPDIFIKKDGEVLFAVECKSKKMTFEAKFAEFPIEEEKIGYDEISKGVFQIWRFFSHYRRGLIPRLEVRLDAVGIVLTLDTWLQMSVPLREEVMAAAKVLADRPGQEIIEEDRRPVVFCSIDDLERVLGFASESKFVDAVQAAATPKYLGWILPNVHRDLSGERIGNHYPFAEQLREVLPWLKGMNGFDSGAPAAQI